ncbi:TonB-dependent receptor [Maribacter sp. PR1]|uniref:TonB-dependent receptor n=1 Tax=Maribacter cobaltidurans TaxID=1178778 RepID=A0ABU7ITJ3_9FLAO|nr:MULTISPECIES: TonB-dependent receptor [Maribacter]MDC6388908.1 TonB-dependent receptor [Maribacter sp. PR1]MEE1976296.1 TonB-dependent receptor [Maribacter cobaltidurans]
MWKPFLISLFFISFHTNVLSQDNQDRKDSTAFKTEMLNEVIVNGNAILGSTFEAKNRTGSAVYISEKELLKFNYNDINRTLKSVPGVNIYEEDGFGLRPNISLRGTSPERSAKINLMEDGVLIAPAPYSAPAAYYFPTIGRMQAVEILKGSSQIQYGPNTTGGAINMISTRIPDEFSGRASIAAGNYGSRNTQLVIGDSYQNFGFVTDYFNYSSDGFKDLDGGGNTGFDKSDYLAKFSVNSNLDAKMYQSLTFKIQYSEEEANETYLGLTDEDFEENPFRRYRASSEDVMNAEHQQYQLTHFIQVSPSLNISTTGYLNKFKRNWYKLTDVNLGERVSINNILSSPLDYPMEYQTILGNEDSQDDVMGIKANNRKYTSNGVQSIAKLRWGSDWLQTLEAGIRYHEDDEDRFQWVDRYAFQNRELIRTTVGVKGEDANRISYAKAVAAHFLYKLSINGLTVTPGLRYENITLGRTDYGSNDAKRSGLDLSERENRVDVWMPGLGANYRFTNNWSVFGGIHKGFSPPGSTDGQNPEQSINYELGTRFNHSGLKGEIIAYYNDYQNLLGSDLAATGGTGGLDQFNAGEVRVSGVEVLLNYDILKNSSEKLRLPVSVSYTLTDTKFLSSFESDTDIFGEVTEGDEIPYIAKNQFNLNLGLEHEKFSLNMGLRYTDAFRTQAGTGTIPANQKVDFNYVIDLSGRYFYNKHLTFSSNIINLLDETYAVSRVPAGLRPGHPFGINFSVAYGF